MQQKWKDGGAILYCSINDVELKIMLKEVQKVYFLVKQTFLDF